MAAKRRKKKRNQRRSSPVARTFKGLYITLVVLSAIVVGLWAVYQFLSQKPTIEGGETPPPPSSNVVVVTDDPDSEEDETQYLARKKDTWTFLLVAKDQVSGSTDTIMVCTYDTANQKVGLVSIPRDTLVVRDGWRYRRINAAYASGGMEELKAAVSQILGIPIDHHVLIDTKIFVELIDAVGGVEFDVPVHMAYDDPYQDLHIHYEPGLQKLSGKQALEVVRCRKNSDGPEGHEIYDAYPDADIGRTRTQQAMVKTVAKKVLSRPQQLGDYIRLFSQYVDTDLTLGNLLWFAGPALEFDFANLTTATLPGDGNATWGKLTYLYALDVEGCLEIINDCLNPYTTPVTRDMVHMQQGD